MSSALFCFPAKGEHCGLRDHRRISIKCPSMSFLHFMLACCAPTDTSGRTAWGERRMAVHSHKGTYSGEKRNVFSLRWGRDAKFSIQLCMYVTYLSRTVDNSHARSSFFFCFFFWSNKQKCTSLVSSDFAVSHFFNSINLMGNLKSLHEQPTQTRVQFSSWHPSVHLLTSGMRVEWG